jgi:hypothetical protein
LEGVVIAALILAGLAVLVVVLVWVGVKLLQIPDLPAWRLMAGVFAMYAAGRVGRGTLDAVVEVYSWGEGTLIAGAALGLAIFVGSVAVAVCRRWRVS